MSKEMVITSTPQETKVAILEEDQLVEVHIERSHEQGIVGSIYKGRVTKVLPGMQSAFVNIGLERDAFLYVSDFFEEAEELGSLTSSEDEKIDRMDVGPEDLGRSGPAIIEVPTRSEGVPAGPAESSAETLAVAPTPAVPPIAESAITTQPPEVNEKVAEAAAIQEKQVSGEPGPRGRNEFDRQGRGRYGRRRGRRRPWERRREEQSRNATPTITTPSAAPEGGSNEIPHPAPVVSVLTPLPGESFSKLQQNIEPVAELSTLPLEETATESEEGEGASETEVPRVEQVSHIIDHIEAPVSEPTLEPVGEISTPEELSVSPFVELEAETELPVAESPGISQQSEEASVPAEVSEEVRRESVVPEVSVLPPMTATIAKEHLASAVELPTPTESSSQSETVAARNVSGPIGTVPKPITTESRAEVLAPAVEHEISAKAEEVKAFPQTSSADESAPAATEAVAPAPREQALSETSTENASSEMVKTVPTAAVEPATSSEPSTVAGQNLAEESVFPGEAAGTAPHESSVSTTPISESVESAPTPAVTEETSQQAAPFSAGENLPPVVGEVEKSPLIEVPPAIGVPPATSAPAPQAEAPTVTPSQINPPPPPAMRRERERGFREKSYGSRRFEDRREKMDRAVVAPPISQPEVYGPPTPYEFMTDDEKVAYNTRKATSRAGARIQDSSRKLTAPQPRERDFGYQRGRRGRRGRKRFGDRESREAATAREEKKQATRPMIADLLREGQEILVQVAKEPLGKKGARITSHIALPGRYLVYMPTVDHIGVSRKIGTDEERHRLKRIINENRVGLTGGFIVRTAAEGRTEEELKQDIRFLANLWTDIRARAEKRPSPALLHRDLGVLERIMRDQLGSEFTAIRLDNETEYAKVLEFVNQFQPALVGRVKLHLKDTPIFEEYGVDREIDKALKPKVWLKSGGYIVINQTEAMVAIDVNTGKFVGKTSRLEDTIVKTNIDAAKEVARQVRLRDMGGIIVIDFIDMEERKNRQKVIQALEEAMRNDRAPFKILAFNDFGLVALTRKRVKQSLEKTLLQPCAYCQGHGMIKSIQTVCYEIQGEAKKMAPELDGKEIRIRVHPEVARALKTSEQSVVNEIEAHTHKDVMIKADPSTHQDQFEIY